MIFLKECVMTGWKLNVIVVLTFWMEPYSPALCCIDMSLIGFVFGELSNWHLKLSLVNFPSRFLFDSFSQPQIVGIKALALLCCFVILIWWLAYVMFCVWLHSTGDSDTDLKDSSPSEQATGINLWERLGKSAMLDIESSSFCWENLSSLHHTEHSGSTEQSDEDMYKTIEVWSYIVTVKYRCNGKILGVSRKVKIHAQLYNGI